MTAEEVGRLIEDIIERDGKKADKARALFDLGCDRSDVTALLGMSYSQAHSIWSKRGRVNHTAGNHRSRNHGPEQSTIDVEPSDGGSRKGGGLTKTPLHLSPSQTRYATHSGHVVVRVDKPAGPRCRQCDQPLQFSLKWLSFLHSFDPSDPTEVEDIYPD